MWDSQKISVTTGAEEAFVDAVGVCGPSSNVAGSLGKSNDPQVKIALRNALITEAADDAAGVAGANQPHAECLKKDLTSRGYTDDELGALPYCVTHDWPDPFTGLGTMRKESWPSRGRDHQKTLAQIARQDFKCRRAPIKGAPALCNLVQAVSPALSPQCRDVDAEHLGRFFQRHRLFEHNLDMLSFHLLQRKAVIEFVR